MSHRKLSYLNLFFIFVSVCIGISKNNLTRIALLIPALYCIRLASCACLYLFPRIYLETELTILELYLHLITICKFKNGR